MKFILDTIQNFSAFCYGKGFEYHLENKTYKSGLFYYLYVLSGSADAPASDTDYIGRFTVVKVIKIEEEL